MKLKRSCEVIVFCWLCLCAVLPKASAQIAKEDITKIRQVYEKSKVMSFHTIYSFYETEASKTPVESETGMVKIDGDKSFCKIGDLEVTTTPSYVFSIDHEIKEIAIMGRILSKYPSPKPNIDTLLNSCKSIRYFTAGKGLGGYEAVCPSNQYSKVILIFDRQTFLLSSLTFVYAEEQTYGLNDKKKSKVKLEIKYLDYKLDEVFPKDTFTYDPYLSKVGKDYFVKKNYLSYHFLNDGRPRK